MRGKDDKNSCAGASGVSCMLERTPSAADRADSSVASAAAEDTAVHDANAAESITGKDVNSAVVDATSSLAQGSSSYLDFSPEIIDPYDASPTPALDLSPLDIDLSSEEVKEYETIKNKLRTLVGAPLLRTKQMLGDHLFPYVKVIKTMAPFTL